MIRVSTAVSPKIGERAAAFGRRQDISARSVLVTIFGDSVVPAGGEIWLGDLIELCAPFGFSDRLVRTSMFRLSAEGWFDTERVGRRSRYRLTPGATDEFAEAEARIYHVPVDVWDERWTLVFPDVGTDAKPARTDFRDSLRRHGFATVSPGMMAVPRPEQELVHRLAVRCGVDGDVAVAIASFSDLAPLVATGWPGTSFGTAEPAERYHDFLERYAWTEAWLDGEEDEGPGPTDAEAFIVRTMVVHDIRRPRLADPDLPAALLADDWPGRAAFALAARAYRGTDDATWRWLSTAAELTIPDPPPARFVTTAG